MYCQLSITESFGVTLLEAMACGCVPVVARRDALPELAGDAGFQVPYGDVERTREAILAAMKMDGTIVREWAATFTKESAKMRIDMLLRSLV